MATDTKVVSGRRKGKGIILVFLTPALLFYMALFLYPAFSAFRISLYKWSGFYFKNATYVGLANFKEAITDKWVHLALGNNLLIMVVGGSFMFILALFFAVVLTNPHLKGRAVFKTLIFLPNVINEVGVALLWIFIYQPRFGMLNIALRTIGLDRLAKVWLGSRELAMPCIIFVIVWYVIGFYMVLLIAGIEGIPTDLYDAAKVDGANEWQVFWRVTLPLLRDVLAIAVVYWMIGSLKIFGIVWAMTKGQPANSTHTVATYMMQQALPYQTSLFRMGYGTAIAVLLFIVVFFIALLFFRLSRTEAIEY